MYRNTAFQIEHNIDLWNALPEEVVGVKSWGHTVEQRVASVLVSVTSAIEPVAKSSPLPQDTGPE